MQLKEFRAMVGAMVQEVPAEYLDGIAAAEVSPAAVPDPVLPDVWTLGECVPVPTGGHSVTSRVVLYYGSFRALAQQAEDFDWHAEAWETLTHELRHHLEWCANQPDLEEYDWAAEQNFRRQHGEPFDPLFFQAGERIAPAVTCVDDDFFLEQVLTRVEWKRLAHSPRRFRWRGAGYEVDVPSTRNHVMYVSVDDVDEPPPGEMILVLRRRPRVTDFFFKRGGNSVTMIQTLARRLKT